MTASPCRTTEFLYLGVMVVVAARDPAMGAGNEHLPELRPT